MGYQNTYHAEAAVLGCLLLEGELIKETRLSQEHFDDPRHRQIMDAMRRITQKEKAIDLVSVVTALDDRLNQVGGVKYLSQLADSVPSVETFRHYEALVFEAYAVRQAQKRALEFAENPSLEGIQEVVNDITRIQEGAIPREKRTKRDVLLDVMDRMHEEKNNTRGIPSGIRDLDEMTGGWQKQDFIVIAARPSVGKTAFALGIGEVNCKNGGVTDIFSLEMPDTQLMSRILSAQGNIDLHKWKDPNRFFSSYDYHKATLAIAKVDKWGLEIHDNPNMTVADIRRGVRETKKKYPNKDHLVIVDYLQLIRSIGKKGETRQQEVSEISRDLKGIAREFDVPVIALSQLSRGVESRQDKRPMMSDIRESGSIEQDADVIAFLYRDDYYDKTTENQNIIEIILAKQRNGPTGTVEAAFIKEYGKFVNLDRLNVRKEGA
ncbi:replicative DNA helicase [Halalkalibacterium halodurans]|uniref:replicative DNA helicase n=1 Tax=Halalkalibacterium halodurans TaxID=86665 RepID=UPI002E1CBC0F|nr:replicative DNA helicase [Halalkalibacterium halodurans]MED4126466.1 replicative DNA helicase [Halalkalibacterium halodurans]